MNDLESTLKLIFHAVETKMLDELRSAEQKFPGWPDDIVHASAIVAEEAGELVKAALDRHYGRAADDDELIREGVQTAAMALRFLLNLKLKKEQKKWPIIP